MSRCQELSRLVAGGREADFRAHRDACAECEALAREMDSFAEVAGGLRRPSPPPALFSALYAIPRQTVSCEGAEELLARRVENEIEAADDARLESHLSRCEACVEAGEVLGVVRSLERPKAAPWLPARLVASRPTKAARRSRGWLFSPRGAITVAYAAAVLVMMLGLNPADLARKAGTARLEQTARSGVATARNALVDRFGALQERAFRSFEVFKGRVGGYGRAAFSNALALVMRTDTSRRSSRPRNEDGSGAWKQEQKEIWTWRAERSPGGES